MRRERRLFTGGYRETKLKAISGIMLTLLLVGMLTWAFNIEPDKSIDDTWPNVGTPSQEPEPDNVLEAQVVTVSVNASDTESGVKAVILSYSKNGGDWKNVTMSKAAGDTYEGIIPGLPAGTQVRYMIIAYDNAGNYFVEDNVGLYYTYMVKPAPKPVGGKATPINILINKPELQIPWIWLSAIILSLVLTVVYVKKRKRHTEINS